MTARPVRWGIVVLGVVSAMAVGALVAVLVLHPFAPSNLNKAGSSTHITVGRQEFLDARSVQLRLALGGERTAVSPTSGRITSLTCTVGSPLGSGRSAISVDGIPLLSLATSIPLWRDLPRGATGSDVTALQAVLTASGFTVSGDRNRVGSQTIAAMRQLFAAAGGSAPNTQTIPQSRILWVPSTTAPVAGCPRAVGQYVSLGDPVLRFPASLVGARVVSQPANLLSGSRVLRIGTLSVPVTASGVVSDETDLAKIEQTSQYVTASAGSSTPTLNAVEQLAKPTTIVVVPPATLVGVVGNRACILSHGHPYSVTIAGSQLGESYIQFTGSTPQSVDLRPSASATCK